jgi:geranylgeranyl pyrophosphate synthase
MQRVFYILMHMESNPGSLDLAGAMHEVDSALKNTLLKYADLLPPSLITMGKLALHAPGKVMAWSTALDRGQDSPFPRWPLLVILGFRAASHPSQRDTWHTAIPAAVAVELAIAAADLIDEAADSDPSLIIERYGPGQASNTANLMLVMAQQVLQWEVAAVNTNALLALGALQDMLVEAAVGQHLDMEYEKMPPRDVTPDMSGQMTDKKAGALMAGALRMGALMAGAEPDVAALLARLGRQLGGIAQVNNDIQDVLPREITAEAYPDQETADWPKPKTDLRQRKRTLPIVYALRAESDQPSTLQAAYAGPPTEHEDEDAMRQAVIDAGGLRFAYLVIDVYRNNAAEAIAALEELRPGATDELQPLL